MNPLRDFWPLVKEAVNGWMEDRAASMGAALAYYTVFSLAPLLIIVITVAGIFFGRDAAQEAIVTQLGGLVGESHASTDHTWAQVPTRIAVAPLRRPWCW